MLIVIQKNQLIFLKFIIYFPVQSQRDWPTRARLFHIKTKFAYKRNEAKLDLFRMCFACSIKKFT